MAKFTEELAEELRKRGAPNATIKVWRHRGRIPDNIVNAQGYGRTNPNQTAWLRKIVSNPIIINRNLGATNDTLSAITTGRAVSVQIDDYHSVKKWVDSFKKEAAKYVKYGGDDRLKKLLRSIVAIRLLTTVYDREQAHRIATRLGKNYSLFEGEEEKIQEAFRQLIAALK